MPPKRHRRIRQKNKQKSVSLPKELVQVAIYGVGAKGDGLAKDDGGHNYFVPYSVEGDVAQVQITAKRTDGFVADIKKLISPGPHRVEAPCPYFTKCGGCSLQHLDPASYKSWKIERVIESLRRNSISIEPLEPVLVPQGQRRRASFTVVKKGKKVILGFNTRASHHIEEIENCLLLNQNLNALIPHLRTLLPIIMKKEGTGDVIINFPTKTADIVFALPGEMDIKTHQQLMDFAETHNIGRMSWQEDGKGEPQLIIQRSPVTTQFGETTIELPPSPFLQPSKMGEEALIDFAMSALGNEKKILDLYAGCGSFTFALAQHGIVHAVETNQAALKALELSAGRAKLGGRITTEVRDLTRQPIMGKELLKFDAVLFDPPRAGAREQVEHLAKSPIGLIIAVSCNPTTFARDASTLIEGGYKLEKLLPVDQFTWSAHVEVAAIFRK